MNVMSIARLGITDICIFLRSLCKVTGYLRGVNMRQRTLKKGVKWFWHQPCLWTLPAHCKLWWVRRSVTKQRVRLGSVLHVGIYTLWGVHISWTVPHSSRRQREISIPSAAHFILPVWASNAGCGRGFGRVMVNNKSCFYGASKCHTRHVWND